MSRIVNTRPMIERNPRIRDEGYLHWLHGLPCIACEIYGVSGTDMTTVTRSLTSRPEDLRRS